MTDIFDFIDELKELQSLYNSGDLRNFDFERLTQKYERQVSRFEEAMEAEYAGFQDSFYSPTREV